MKKKNRLLWNTTRVPCGTVPAERKSNLKTQEDFKVDKQNQSWTVLRSF